MPIIFQNLDSVIGRADILIVAMGQPGFVKGSWIKQGAVVIDCGITSIADDTRKATKPFWCTLSDGTPSYRLMSTFLFRKSGYRLSGDVEFSSASERASHITPVPGGVGPMTVAFLMNNTVQESGNKLDRNKSQSFVGGQPDKKYRTVDNLGFLLSRNTQD
jgi:methylenetetrahydrofolate dehydrogenase (NADP+)/methenyltetrahydrofolate cyclohydrolase/formyltetrahydrofolate synthetase